MSRNSICDSAQGVCGLVWRVGINDLNGEIQADVRHASKSILGIKGIFIGMRSVMDLDADSNYWVHAIVGNIFTEGAFYIKLSPDTITGAIKLQFKPKEAALNEVNEAVISPPGND